MFPWKELSPAHRNHKRYNTVTVQNDPPIIFVSTTPAIILQLEGEPAMTDATPGGIKYVFNANWPVFFDPTSSNYFLFDDNEWQTATQLSGPWTFTAALPDVTDQFIIQ